MAGITKQVYYSDRRRYYRDQS